MSRESGTRWNPLIFRVRGLFRDRGLIGIDRTGRGNFGVAIPEAASPAVAVLGEGGDIAAVVVGGVEAVGDLEFPEVLGGPGLIRR